MIKTKKNILIVILSFLAMVFLALGMLGMPSYSAKKVKATSATNATVPTLTMGYGAAIRVNSTEDFSDNGLRFRATLSETEYQKALRRENVSFGMFIMPVYYVEKFGDLTAENVSLGGVYDWKENDGDTYFYGGDEIHAETHRIIAISYPELFVNPDNAEQRIILGSVVNLKEENLSLEYIGRAFIRYQVDGVYFYEMAAWSEDYQGNTYRSPVEIAEKELAYKNSHLSDEQKIALFNGYLAKNLNLQGYTPITSAADFAAMTASGKYYLSQDIAVDTAYVNEFTGVLNGNGKRITLADGTSLFNAFSGTLENVKITANASVIVNMNGGKVMDADINYTYSSEHPYAVAANASNTAWIERVSVGTTNTESTKIGHANVNENNNVLYNGTDATFYEITFVSDYGSIVRKYLSGDSVNAEKLQKAGSFIGGTVNDWNKSANTVTTHTAYYAKDVTISYDTEKAWTLVAENPLIDGIAVGGETPVGYSQVFLVNGMNKQATQNNGVRHFANVALDSYREIRFAFRMTGATLLAGWGTYFDVRDAWVFVSAVNNLDGSWTLTINAKEAVSQADPYVSTVTCTSLQELLAVWYNPYKFYCTEVYGVEIEPQGEKIADKAFDSATITDVAAPAGFESVYVKEGFAKGDFADVDISGYSEVYFQMKANGWILFNGWSNYVDKRNTWLPVTLVDDGNGNWTATVNGQSANTSSGNTLSSVLSTWYSDYSSEPFEMYVTEIRGQAKEIVEETVGPWGSVIQDCVLISNVTLDTETAAPTGFEAVYAVSGTLAKNGQKSTLDLSGYSEVRFAFKSEQYFLFYNWDIYLQGSFTDWVVVTMQNKGDGNWTVIVNGSVYDGSISNPYTFEYTGNTVQELLANWYNGKNIYVTELRADVVADSQPWGEKVADSAFANTTSKVTVLPSGYETVSEKSGFAKGDFANVDITRYSEIRFQVNASSWVLLDGWSVYYDVKNQWIPWTLTNVGENEWRLRIDVKTNTAAYYEETLSGSTLQELFANYYNGGEITIMCTEVRGIKTSVYGERIVNGVLKDVTELVDESAPARFENVYTKAGFNGDFANVDISQYSQVRFAIKSDGWVLLNGSWATYYDHRNWVSVVLTNNNDGTWELQWYAQAQNSNGEATSEYPWTKTLAGRYLKDFFKKYSNSGAAVYITELRGIKNAMPEVPELPEIEIKQPIELEAMASPVLWGEQVAENAMVGFTRDGVETVPNGYEMVYSGVPATTQTDSGTRVGELFNEIDVSQYSEVRFAFKSSSWMLFGGWEHYVQEPNAWIPVSLKQSQNAKGTWTVTVYAKDLATGAMPYVETRTGSTLQEILLSWYNAKGVTFYVTDVRGSKEVLDEKIDTVLAETYLTEDGSVEIPTGFETVYAVSGTLKNNGQKSTLDLSGYGEVRFAFKSEKYFLFYNWDIYLQESFTDWVVVTMQNKGNGNWTVIVNGNVYDGSISNPYTFAYTGNTLQEILVDWYNGNNIYVTELRGVGLEGEETQKISNLVCTTLYEAVDEAVPEGYENVYLKEGLNKGDFADVDISNYSEVSFQIKANGWILFDGWSSYIDQANTWLPVSLINNGNGSWTATVNGQAATTSDGNTLKEVLANWYSDYSQAPFKAYVTELRGKVGYYQAEDVKGIAVSAADYQNATVRAAITELVSHIKEFTGVELLVEYCDHAAMLDKQKSYIVIGDLATTLGASGSDIVSETGYTIGSLGNDTYLLANSPQGILNAVYGFMESYFGLVYYTDTVRAYTESNPLFGTLEKTTVNPSFDYAWAVDGTITKSNNGEYNLEYMRRVGFSNIYEQLGCGWHNFLTVISEEKYGANGTVSQNANWFVTKTVNGVSNKTLDIANYGDAIAVAVANELAAMINADTRTLWPFTAPDFVDESFTSDMYVAFMNKVAEQLNGQISREIQLLLLAYNSTFAAPQTTFVPQTNVGFAVMVAPIETNYYYDFGNTTFTNTDGRTNAWYLEQIQAWQAKVGAGNLFAWNYSEYFDNYFVPLATITNMQSRYQAYAESGVSAIHDQGAQNAVAPDWAVLKTFLKARLAMDVNGDVDAWIEDFMNAYYGEAATPYMLQLLKAQQSHYATIAGSMNGGHITRATLFNKELWQADMLVTWYGYIQSALNVTTDETLRNRIHTEGLTVRYLYNVLYTHKDSILDNDNPTLTITAVGATSTSSDSIEQIRADAKALGINRFAEGQGWICNDDSMLSTDNLVDGAIDNLA